MTHTATTIWPPQPEGFEDLLREAADTIGSVPVRPDRDTVTVTLTIAEAWWVLDEAVIYAGYHPHSRLGEDENVDRMAASRCVSAVMAGINTGEPFELRANRDVLRRVADCLFTLGSGSVQDSFGSLPEYDRARRGLLEQGLCIKLLEAIEAAQDSETGREGHRAV